MDLRKFVKQILIQKQNNSYQQELNRIQTTYDQWIREKEVKEQKEMELTAIGKDSKADFLIFCSSKGRLAEGTKGILGRFFEEHPDCLLVYGDEDVQETENSERQKPWFKPEWSPETFQSCFYFGSLFAVRCSLLEQCGFVSQDEGIVLYSQVQELASLAFRLVQAAGGWARFCKGIGHIPKILFHAISESVWESYFRGKEYKNRNSQEASAKQKMLSSVSVVIPSKDHPQMLEQAISSFLENIGQLPPKQEGGFRTKEEHQELNAFEIIIVDNGSSPSNRSKLERLTEEFNKFLPVSYHYCPMPFHFSKMCNYGAQKAKRNLLLFLNDDVELIGTGTLYHMAELALKPYAGAVGVKLLYPENNRIQHAGIVNLPMGPVHKLQFLPDTQNYDFGRSTLDYNVLAVTGACLMVQKVKFMEAGGFPEELPVAFNDVSLCFRLHELGYTNVCANSQKAYHLESVSRGEDESIEKIQRLMMERTRLYQRHPSYQGGVDPYYSRELNHDGLDTRIRPAYETAGNKPQRELPSRAEDVSAYRQDPCLLIRIEYCGSDKIQGYSVVLGDNNACYEKSLWLEEQTKGQFYTLKLRSQYRPDLAENMQDQINVALCGFLVEWPQQGLAKGTYRIGVSARNRVNRTKLINWSNRELTL